MSVSPSQRMTALRGHAVKAVPCPHCGRLPTDSLTERRVGSLRINYETHRVLWHGHPVAVTKTEFKIIGRITSRPDAIFSRDQLMTAGWGALAVTDRNVDTHIKRIRLSFKKVDPKFDMIKTLWGVGYRWRVE